MALELFGPKANINFPEDAHAARFVAPENIRIATKGEAELFDPLVARLAKRPGVLEYNRVVFESHKRAPPARASRTTRRPAPPACTRMMTTAAWTGRMTTLMIMMAAASIGTN
jgi:hypothetical protein